jgi:serine/threonine protein kinase
MTPQKTLKEQLEALDLAGTKVRVALPPDEIQTFEFEHPAGSGKKAVTWKVKDRFSWPFALKFVPKTEYYAHSIDAELHKTRELGAKFAQIRLYGQPQFDQSGLDSITNNAYAVIVEWVDGQTFTQFCEDEGETLEVSHFMALARDFCEVLALLKQRKLSHSDLHADNVMIVKEPSGLSGAQELTIKIIDTGSLMTEEFRSTLLENWRAELSTLQQVAGSSAEAASLANNLSERIDWFSRGDHAWIVSHLSTLVNRLRRNASRLPTVQRKFVNAVTPLLARMIDPDPFMRLDDPAEMFQEIDMLWKSIVTPQAAPLLTPFDLISAELIRSNEQLNNLFSDKCPWFESCATTTPVYIYGPRGCGKSTILRKISLPAILSDPKARQLFGKWPYIGVYISCSSELRSRFWLFPKDLYPDIQGDVVLFFTTLLAEALLGAFELLRDGEVERILGQSVGLTKTTEENIAEVICTAFDLQKVGPKLGGISWLTYARKRLAIKRSEVWKSILTNPSKRTPNPALLFDVCRDLEEVFPLLREKHIAFLIDDYSNQRIPVELQRMLNQTISFAKQGNPIFKVSSEYQGVDLEGIQEGREVVEVNFGKEYVDLTESRRSVFLEDVLDIRFRQAGVNTTAKALLGRSGIKPTVPMARQIRRAEVVGEPFYYHGIDTIADICSGDLAMALDLVKKIYVTVKDRIPLSECVPIKKQDEIIHQYSDREHTYNRYFPLFGKEIAEIADRLCWLAHEATIHRDSRKEGKVEPMIKTHLDIPLTVAGQLPDKWQLLLHEMQRKGVLFSLDTSRSRIANDGTERYQVRRILLVRYRAPLGRRDPIKMDNIQKLLHLLQEPKQFVDVELNREGIKTRRRKRDDPRQGNLLND